MDEVTFPSIKDLLPHAPPMILLDEMVEVDERGCACRITIREDNPLFHRDGLPSYAGLEFMAQTIGALSGYRAIRQGLPVKLGFLLGTPYLRSSIKVFSTGQTLRIRIDHAWGERELLRFACRIHDELTRDLLQEAEVNVYRPANLDEFIARYQL